MGSLERRCSNSKSWLLLFSLYNSVEVGQHDDSPAQGSDRHLGPILVRDVGVFSFVRGVLAPTVGQRKPEPLHHAMG